MSQSGRKVHSPLDSEILLDCLIPEVLTTSSVGSGTGNVWSLAGVPSLAEIMIPIQCK